MFAALFALFGCASKPDVVGLGAMGAVPELAGDRTYTWMVDGSCATDCPPAGRSQVVFPDCASMETARGAYEQALVNAGFRQVGEQFELERDGRRVVVSVLTYTDAAEGPLPPELSDRRSEFAGRCSLASIADATPADDRASTSP